MASKNSPREEDEQFCICAVCSNELRNPKLLPCLHRFCLDCLIKIEQDLQDGSIICPTCQYKCSVPRRSGVRGFQDDLQVASVLKVKYLRNSLVKKQSKRCGCCSKRSNVPAYCFKCDDYLCDQCYQSHLQADMYVHHKPNTVNLMVKSLKREKRAYCKQIPTCDNHPNQSAHTCCSTCENLPICLACTSGEHRYHDMINASHIAEVQRYELHNKLAELDLHESKISEIPKRVGSIQQKLMDNAEKKKTVLNLQFKEKSNEVETSLEKQRNEMEQKISEIEERRKSECSQIKRETEIKRQKLLGECEGVIKEKNRMFSDQIALVEKNYQLEKEKRLQKLERLIEYLKESIRTVDFLVQKNKRELREVLTNVELIRERHGNFRETLSHLLHSNDDWSDARYLWSIKSACGFLIEELKTDFPDLEPLSDFIADDFEQFGSDHVTITGENMVAVSIGNIVAKRWSIDDATGSTDGRIVITGSATKEYSHISVVSGNGQVIRQQKITRPKVISLFPNRFCSFISEDKIATVCVPDEIGLYNIQDGSYLKKNINGIVEGWSVGQRVYCIATDPANKLIIVGTNSRDVYVFDYQLAYRRTITLPDEIRYCMDIAIHAGRLLVCDYSGKNACAVAIDGSEGKLTNEFTKPDIGKGQLQPLSVCTDIYGYVYIIWLKSNGHQLTRFMSQYNQDCEELLTTIPLKGDARCVFTFKEDKTERIAVTTLTSGKLYTIDRDHSIYEFFSDECQRPA